MASKIPEKGSHVLKKFVKMYDIPNMYPGSAIFWKADNTVKDWGGVGVLYKYYNSGTDADLLDKGTEEDNVIFCRTLLQRHVEFYQVYHSNEENSNQNKKHWQNEFLRYMFGVPSRKRKEMDEYPTLGTFISFLTYQYCRRRTKFHMLKRIFNLCFFFSP